MRCNFHRDCAIEQLLQLPAPIFLVRLVLTGLLLPVKEQFIQVHHPCKTQRMQRRNHLHRKIIAIRQLNIKLYSVYVLKLNSAQGCKLVLICLLEPLIEQSYILLDIGQNATYIGSRNNAALLVSRVHNLVEEALPCALKLLGNGNLIIKFNEPETLEF